MSKIIKGLATNKVCIFVCIAPFVRSHRIPHKREFFSGFIDNCDDLVASMIYNSVSRVE